jgi:hypothetical protein
MGSRERFELSMFRVGGSVPSAGGVKLVASSGLEPPSVRLEGAGPHSLGEAELERVRGVEPIKIAFATSSRASL